VQDSTVGSPSPKLGVHATGLFQQRTALLEPYRVNSHGPPSWDDVHRMTPTRLFAPGIQRDQLNSDGIVGRIIFGQM